MADKSLHILCFGDSLTSGYHNWGAGSHPYSVMLQIQLEAAFPDVVFNIVTNGRSGDVASEPPFERRLQAACNKYPYDWVIILGGTNDLGFGIETRLILSALELCWSIPLTNSAKVLALTIPECRVASANLDQKRDAINGAILAHEEPDFYSFDLKSAIPYHSLSDEDRDLFWDDGLHLSEDGYDWMGGHIGQALADIIRGENGERDDSNRNKDNSSTPSKPTQEPSSDEIGEDFVQLDEEAGSDRDISKGYIIVRKKDLD